MTAIVHYHSRKTDKSHIRHSYLMDTGDEIEVPQVMEYKWKVFDTVILKPPHPRTRFFELIIREERTGNSSQIDDLQVCPVHAKQKPDLRILGFTLKKGAWEITERIYKKGSTTDVQWIYTDDFHLFAITHASESLESIVDQVAQRIDDISLSIRKGYRISSHMEKQRVRREEFDAVIGNRSGITIDKTAILKHPEYQLVADMGESDRKKMQDNILRDLKSIGSTLDTPVGLKKGQPRIAIPAQADIDSQLARAAELQDLEWLFE